MGDENPVRTLRDYSRPSHKGYQNTTEIPDRNNVVPLRSDTIRIHLHLGGSYYSFPCSILSIGKTAKLHNDILMFQLHQGKLHDRNAKESWALLEDLALYDNKSWNDPRDFAKPVKAISLPQDVPSTSDRRLIELQNQFQRLMEAHLAPKSSI
ncbi:hypothetical protein Tco_0639231 [Tanacetum coccineum]